MTSRNIGFIATALVASAVGLWVWRIEASAPLMPTLAAGSTPRGLPVAWKEQPKSILSDRSPPSAKLVGSSSEGRSTVEESKNKYALAKALLPRAQAGDAKAQYLLFLAMWDCLKPDEAHQYQMYPTWEAKRQLLIQNAIPQKNIGDEEAVYRVCAGFFENDIKSLGDSWDWLKRAADAGYALAQAETAAQRLQQDQWKVYERAGDPPGITADLPPIGGDDVSPRELLTLAVQTGDPEVLDRIGDLQQMLNPTQSRETNLLNEVAWRYAACQRMGGCPVGWGPATSTNCAVITPNCVPVPNTWLTWVNGNWAPVQERVDQINAAIAAQQWDQLGLGAGS